MNAPEDMHPDPTALKPDDEMRAVALKTIDGMLFGSEWNWTLNLYDSARAVRCTTDEATYCPITALARVKLGGEPIPSYLFTMAANRLHMDLNTATLIAQAADDYPGCDPQVRAALLKRLGLEDVA